MARTTSGYERMLVASSIPVWDWWEQARQRLRGKPQRVRAVQIASGLNILALTGLAVHLLRVDYLLEPVQRAAESGLLTVLLATALSASLVLSLTLGKNAPAQARETTPMAAGSFPEHQQSHDVTDIEAERRVTELMAQMGHELRTPLNAIIGFSDMMHRELLGPLGTTRYRSYAADIRDSGVALLEAVESTLTLTRSMAEPASAPLPPTALRDVIGEAIARAAPEAEARGLRFDVSDTQSTPPALPRVLQQVLTAVVKAAVSAAETNTAITIQGPCARTVGDAFLITVRVDHIAARTSAQARPDEPLAIAVARTLLELQGGRLDVRHDVAGSLAFQILLGR
jgi:signal transduction histidine kinase